MLINIYKKMRQKLSSKREVRGIFFHGGKTGGLSQVDTMLASIDELKTHGIYLRDHIIDAGCNFIECISKDDDFILAATDDVEDSVIEKLLSVNLLSVNLPVFLIVRGASGSVNNGTAQLLRDDRVTAVIRNTNLTDLSLNNYLTKDGHYRFHYKLLNEDDGQTGSQLRQPPITIKSFDKLLTGYSIATYPKLDKVASLKWDLIDLRDIDISFVGKTQYGESDFGLTLERHRNRAVESLTKLDPTRFNVYCTVTKTQTVKAYTKRRFYKIMLRSKAVLSPWGFGEVCIRDFEAMLAGAIVIKPDMSHLTTIPDFYRANETYIPCRRDFSDVEDLLERVVHDWKGFRAMRREARHMVMESRKPERIATQIAELIYRGLSLSASDKVDKEQFSCLP